MGMRRSPGWISRVNIAGSGCSPCQAWTAAWCAAFLRPRISAARPPWAGSRCSARSCASAWVAFWRAPGPCSANRSARCSSQYRRRRSGSGAPQSRHVFGSATNSAREHRTEPSRAPQRRLGQRPPPQRRRELPRPPRPHRRPRPVVPPPDRHPRRRRRTATPRHRDATRRRPQR
jgi:hypothetical protein